MLETRWICLRIIVQYVASISFRTVILVFHAEAVFVFHIEENLFGHVIPGLNLTFQEVPKKCTLLKYNTNASAHISFS